MKTVKRLLQSKGNGKVVWSTTPDASVDEALRLMNDKDVGALVVLENNNLVGIVTERDYTKKVIPQGKSMTETHVEDIMSRRVLYVRPEQSLDECMALMTDRHLRHLPVMEKDELVGIVSIRDIIKDVVSEQEFIISQLENYIMDRPPQNS